MRLIEAKRKLQQKGLPILQTHEVAKILDLSNSQASLVLHRLEEAGELLSLKKGLWLIEKRTNPFLIGEHLARPYPAYVSLQSALYIHGIVSQIPETVYLMTPARSQKRIVSETDYSFHHIESDLFKGFALHEGFNLATPEKALFDFWYLSATSKRIFKGLPELDIPKGFKRGRLNKWANEILNPRLRSHVRKKIEVLGE